MKLTNFDNRLVSLDFFRGFVMFLLIAEFSNLFASLRGGDLFLKIIRPFSNSLIKSFSPWLADFISGIVVLFGLWYICYWLYKKQIFIKI